MEWYLPITVLPGIGLLILSTSNLLRSLNKEIIKLNSDRKMYSEIIGLKIKQLKRLNWSLVFLYLGVLFFLLAGMTGAVYHQDNFFTGMFMVGGLLVLILALLLLIIYGFKSVYIREKHLKL